MNVSRSVFGSLALTALLAITPQAQSEVHRPGNGVTLPTVVREVKPDYTQAAMQERIQGSVWLSCVVDESGDVRDIQVTRSLDKEFGLDQAAVDAAAQWKFKPGQKAGKAVAVRITLELTFRLK